MAGWVVDVAPRMLAAPLVESPRREAFLPRLTPLSPRFLMRLAILDQSSYASFCRLPTPHRFLPATLGRTQALEAASKR
jgi:hypothetical protein